jgi:HlyD family secretion protein
VLACTGGLLLYAARSALVPAPGVWVVPVVTKPLAEGSAPGPREGPAQVIVQAPGWVEADPYAISVPALVEGVVEEVLVLEGERVEAGQVVARLIDEDARLALQRARADLEAMKAEAERSRAEAQSAAARAEEVRDEVTRKRPLLEGGGISEGQLARLELRLRAMETEVNAAQARVALAEANVRSYEVICDEAELALARTEVVSPAAGIVMARLVEPGARISMNGAGGEMSGAVVRLYDPAKLQVRADIPLAEAAKVGVGTRAQIMTEALPDQTFSGVVSRLVHEADIQRNTVQVKVAIESPSQTLRPQMLARVRFLGGSTGSSTVGDGPALPGSGANQFTLLIPSSSLLRQHPGHTQVWIVDQSRREPAAALVDVSTRAGPEGLLVVDSGLRPGDRLIIDPPAGLAHGDRIRIRGEKVN